MKSLERMKTPEGSKIRQVVALGAELDSLLSGMSLKENKDEILEVIPAMLDFTEIVKKLDDLNLSEAFLEKIKNESHNEESLKVIDSNIKMAEMFERAGKTIKKMREISLMVEDVMQRYAITRETRDVLNEDTLSHMEEKDEQLIKRSFALLGTGLQQTLDFLKFPLLVLARINNPEQLSEPSKLEQFSSPSNEDKELSELSRIEQFSSIGDELDRLLLQKERERYENEISKVIPAMLSIIEIIKKLDDLDVGTVFLEKIEEKKSRSEALEIINPTFAETIQNLIKIGKMIKDLREKSQKIEEVMQQYTLIDELGGASKTERLTNMQEQNAEIIKKSFLFFTDMLQELVEYLARDMMRLTVWLR